MSEEIDIPFEEEPIALDPLNPEPSAVSVRERLAMHAGGEYADFILGPLKEAWLERHPRQPDGTIARNPTIHEAARLLGSRDFGDYYQGRQRQWLLTRVPNAIEGAKSHQADVRKGQTTIF